MHKKRLIITLTLLLAAVLLPAGYLFHLYRQGSEAHYTPPPPPILAPREQAQADLQHLARAVEAFFTKNLEYPRQLEALVPEFIDQVSRDPAGGQPYRYTLLESGFRISVPDPARYQLQEFLIENDTLRIR